jgi:hypothetical protein
MNHLLNSIGNALGTLMDVTGTVAMTAFFAALVLLVAAVPLYTVYSVVTGLRRSKKA